MLYHLFTLIHDFNSSHDSRFEYIARNCRLRNSRHQIVHFMHYFLIPSYEICQPPQPPDQTKVSPPPKEPRISPPRTTSRSSRPRRRRSTRARATGPIALMLRIHDLGTISKLIAHHDEVSRDGAPVAEHRRLRRRARLEDVPEVAVYLRVIRDDLLRRDR